MCYPLSQLLYSYVSLALQSIQVERTWDLVRDSGQRKLTYSSQNHCTSSRSVYLSRRLYSHWERLVITHHLQKWESQLRLRWIWSLSVSIYLIITLCLWHISYEYCFISSDICLETSNFFLYLQTKIMWYCNRYLCLFLDFHVPMPWVYYNFWFLATLTHRLKPVGLR